MKILCANPNAQYESLQEEINESIAKVLNSGIYINGKETKLLEEEFASYIGTRHAVAVSSGTTAIELVLRSLDLKSNDEVITVAHTAIPTISAIKLAGLTPKLIDIDRESYTMSPEKLEEAISEKTKCVIVVHLYGQGAYLEEIKQICDERKIFLIEDCSQCHGAEYLGVKLGSLGIAGCFSCYPTKNLGALGDAGMITTNDNDLAERIKLAREYGWKTKGISITDGGNYRIDELQSAILRVKIKHLDENNRRRSEIANIYTNNLCELIKKPKIMPSSTHVFHLYVTEVKDRDKIISQLNIDGIYPGIHYYPPSHKQAIYEDYAFGELGNTNEATKRILSLPMYPELSINEVEYVCDKLNRLLKLSK